MEGENIQEGKQLFWLLPGIKLEIRRCSLKRKYPDESQKKLPAHKTYSPVSAVPSVLTEAQLFGSLKTTLDKTLINVEQGTLLHREGDRLDGLLGLFHLSTL